MGNSIQKENREIYIKNLSFLELKKLTLEDLGFAKKNKSTFLFQSKKFIFFSFLIQPKLILHESKDEKQIIIELKKIKINNLSNLLADIKFKVFIKISDDKNGCKINKEYYFNKDIINSFKLLSERFIYKCLIEIIDNIDQRINNIIIDKLNSSSINIKSKKETERLKIYSKKGYKTNDNILIFILIFPLLNTLNMAEIIKFSFINLRLYLAKNNNVVNALIYREMRTRIDNSSIGLLKLLINPFIVIILFTLLKVIISQTSISDSFQFVAPGVIIFFLFRQIVNRSLNAIKANSGILTYKQINPINILLARSIIEFLIYLIIFIVFTIILSVNLNYFFITDLPLFTLVFSLVFIFSFSIGLIGMLLTYKWEFFRELFNVLIMRPLWITSGIFFSIDQLPDNLKQIIVLNPLFQAIELVRNSTIYNSNLMSEYASIKYLIVISLTSFIISIIIYNYSEKSLIIK